MSMLGPNDQEVTVEMGPKHAANDQIFSKVGGFYFYILHPRSF